VRAGARLAATSATAAVVALRAGRLARTETFELHRARALQDGLRAVLRHHGVEVDLAGPLPQGAAIVACNHVSWLDPVVVGAAVPCAPISKLDVRGWPVVGGLASRLGVIFHERGAQASGLRVLREAEASLRAGVPVLNFPEGTTTAGDTVLAFRKGLFGLAARLVLPVVPVAVRYQPADLCWIGRDTFLPHYLRFAARRGSAVRLSFGEPVVAGAATDASWLAAEARRRVASLLEAA
jgi:1-acyl-sn-glycerol-3-phosphate acyltransferase